MMFVSTAIAAVPPVFVILFPAIFLLLNPTSPMGSATAAENDDGIGKTIEKQPRPDFSAIAATQTRKKRQVLAALAVTGLVGYGMVKVAKPTGNLAKKMVHKGRRWLKARKRKKGRQKIARGRIRMRPGGRGHGGIPMRGGNLKQRRGGNGVRMWTKSERQRMRNKLGMGRTTVQDGSVESDADGDTTDADEHHGGGEHQKGKSNLGYLGLKHNGGRGGGGGGGEHLHHGGLQYRIPNGGGHRRGTNGRGLRAGQRGFVRQQVGKIEENIAKQNDTNKSKSVEAQLAHEVENERSPSYSMGHGHGHGRGRKQHPGRHQVGGVQHAKHNRPANHHGRKRKRGRKHRTRKSKPQSRARPVEEEQSESVETPGADAEVEEEEDEDEYGDEDVEMEEGPYEEEEEEEEEENVEHVDEELEHENGDEEVDENGAPFQHGHEEVEEEEEEDEQVHHNDDEHFPRRKPTNRMPSKQYRAHTAPAGQMQNGGHYDDQSHEVEDDDDERRSQSDIGGMNNPRHRSEEPNQTKSRKNRRQNSDKHAVDKWNGEQPVNGQKPHPQHIDGEKRLHDNSGRSRTQTIDPMGPTSKESAVKPRRTFAEVVKEGLNQQPGKNAGRNGTIGWRRPSGRGPNNAKIPNAKNHDGKGNRKNGSVENERQNGGQGNATSRHNSLGREDEDDDVGGMHHSIDGGEEEGEQQQMQNTSQKSAEPTDKWSWRSLAQKNSEEVSRPTNGHNWLGSGGNRSEDIESANRRRGGNPSRENEQVDDGSASDETLPADQKGTSVGNNGEFGPENGHKGKNHNGPKAHASGSQTRFNHKHNNDQQSNSFAGPTKQFEGEMGSGELPNTEVLADSHENGTAHHQHSLGHGFEDGPHGDEQLGLGMDAGQHSHANTPFDGNHSDAAAATNQQFAHTANNIHNLPEHDVDMPIGNGHTHQQENGQKGWDAMRDPQSPKAQSPNWHRNMSSPMGDANAKNNNNSGLEHDWQSKRRSHTTMPATKQHDDGNGQREQPQWHHQQQRQRQQESVPTTNRSGGGAGGERTGNEFNHGAGGNSNGHPKTPMNARTHSTHHSPNFGDPHKGIGQAAQYAKIPSHRNGAKTSAMANTQNPNGRTLQQQQLHLDKDKTGEKTKGSHGKPNEHFQPQKQQNPSEMHKEGNNPMGKETRLAANTSGHGSGGHPPPPAMHANGKSHAEDGIHFGTAKGNLHHGADESDKDQEAAGSDGNAHSTANSHTKSHDGGSRSVEIEGSHSIEDQEGSGQHRKTKPLRGGARGGEKEPATNATVHHHQSGGQQASNNLVHQHNNQQYQQQQQWHTTTLNDADDKHEVVENVPQQQQQPPVNGQQHNQQPTMKQFTVPLAEKKKHKGRLINAPKRLHAQKKQEAGR